MKFFCLIWLCGLIFCTLPLSGENQGKLVVVNRLQVDKAIRDKQVAAVTLDGRDHLLVRYSNEKYIDPWEDEFFYPRDTFKLALFDLTDNKKLWEIDLGWGIPVGWWFCPVLVYDIDNDGNDEIFYIDNKSPKNPLGIKRQIVELDARTGKRLNAFDIKLHPDRMDEVFRFFLVGGRGKDGQRLICHFNGTYKELYMDAYTRQGKKVWHRSIPRGTPRASHSTHTFDADGDGIDEVMWGERLISLADGHDIFVADEKKYDGHSDIAMPIFVNGEFKYLWACREGGSNDIPDQYRLNLYDNTGKRIWGKEKHGHMHAGGAFRCDNNGGKVVFFYCAGKNEHGGMFNLKGERVEMPSSVGYFPVPIDLDGDGLHELLTNRIIFRHDGSVFANIATYCSWMADCGHFRSDLPGEQLVSIDRKKKQIIVYAYDQARWSEAAKKRYAHPYYKNCLRDSMVGYNWFRGMSGL